MPSQRYFIVYKPFQVLCQFSPENGKRTLKDFFPVPNDVYPVGRLDYDSEGLLILTNDKSLNNRLLNPDHRHEREYWVQVDGDISNHALAQLENGVDISINGKNHQTLPSKARLFSQEPNLPERNPPIRFRKEIPTSWISLTLHEGKNRQVRRMTAAVGFPTLRLVRYRMEKLTIDGFQLGEIREMSGEDINEALFS